MRLDKNENEEKKDAKNEPKLDELDIDLILCGYRTSSKFRGKKDKKII